MKRVFLDFERPVVELEERIGELRHTQGGSPVDLSEEIERLERKARRLLEEIYRRLDAWQITQVARHPLRPYTLDYVTALFTDFVELRGDRQVADDPAIVAGLARFRGIPCAIVGHQKGRDTKEKIRRNFGMPRPEGYRKAVRVMRLAERFGLPLFSFVDTPGAFPGIEAEERNQSEAIGRAIWTMSELRVPTIVTVIGEGGSGGALALAVGDHVAMLRYSIYSVISPEGCASILWKSAEMAATAAEALAITAPRLKDLGVIDAIVPEPVGGAHRYPEEMAAMLGEHLAAVFAELLAMPLEELLQRRRQRLLAMGRFSLADE
ncbi:MAG: acetyl-CoA carboxylase carboxyltransferase subunit alpha [Hydrogenophilus sp.]|nr:acetyl-CoA carboxylase carboxyltransferase subunit alpha [Hydrogenophilus sp.]